MKICKYIAKLKECCSEYLYTSLDSAIIIWKGYLLEIEFQIADYFLSVALKKIISLFILLYNIVWFCHTLTWIRHRCTCGPHPEPPSHLPPHPFPLCYPSAPTPSILYHAWNLNWRFISFSGWISRSQSSALMPILCRSIYFLWLFLKILFISNIVQWCV